MSATTSSATWQRSNLGAFQVQDHVRPNLPIVSLAAIGDTHVLSTSFIEQLSAVNSIGSEVTGVTATRTFTLEFRHSTDNTTFTAWASATLGNLQAITYTANNRAYYQWRMTRTGSDATGLITWNALVLGSTYDPSATSGHGKFSAWGLRSEIKLFLKAIIETVSITYAGRRTFEVLAFEQAQTSKANANAILIADVTTGTGSANTISSDNYPCECDLLIKMQNGVSGNPQGYATEQEQMAGILLDIFRERNWAGNRFSFTFKGISFVAVPLSELGMTQFKVEDRGLVYVKELDSTYNQIRLKFSIFATRNNITIYG